MNKDIISLQTIKNLWKHKILIASAIVLLTSILEQFNSFYFYLYNFNKIRFYAALFLVILFLTGYKSKVKVNQENKDKDYEEYKEFLEFKKYREEINRGTN